jgi:muconolactone delta-isomerase
MIRRLREFSLVREGGGGGLVIIDASSHEELGRTLVGLPVWSRLTWNVTPLESLNETERQ